MVFEEVSRQFEVHHVHPSNISCDTLPIPYEIDPPHLCGKVPSVSIGRAPRYEVVRRYQRDEDEEGEESKSERSLSSSHHRHHQGSSSSTNSKLLVVPLDSGIVVIRQHLLHKLSVWLSPYLQKKLLYQFTESPSAIRDDSFVGHSCVSSGDESVEGNSELSLHSMDILSVDLEKWCYFFHALSLHPRGFRSLCLGSSILSSTPPSVLFVTVQVFIKSSSGISSSSSSPQEMRIRVPLIPLVPSQESVIEPSTSSETVNERIEDDETRPALHQASLEWENPFHSAPLRCAYYYILDMNLITSATHLVLQEKATGVVYPAKRYRCKGFPLTTAELSHPTPAIPGGSHRKGTTSETVIGEKVENGLDHTQAQIDREVVEKCERGNTMDTIFPSSLGMKRERALSPNHELQDEKKMMEVDQSAPRVSAQCVIADRVNPRLGIRYHRLVFFSESEARRLEAVEAAQNVVFELVICSA